MSARTLLDPTAADRLVKLLGMLGSHHDGERANAALMADALIRDRGLTWHDVIAIPASKTTSWQGMASWCRAHHEQFNAKERDFIQTMQAWRGAPTERQQKWLTDLFVRAGGARS